MKKIITSPESYIQGSGKLRNLAEYYQTLGFKWTYMIVDEFICDIYKGDIVKSFEEKDVPYEMNVFGGECSKKEIELHRERLGAMKAADRLGKEWA